MNSYWKEIKNDYRDESLCSEFEKGIKTIVYVDAWKKDGDSEEGEVIAKIVVTNDNKIFVIYINNVARVDKYAQEIIKETMETLAKEYPSESCEKTLKNIELIKKVLSITEDLEFAIVINNKASAETKQSDIEEYMKDIKGIINELKV